jgi:hypothetical protein
MTWMLPLGFAFSLGIAFICPSAASAKAASSAVFKSKLGFEVVYPRHWHVLARDGSELDILSSARRVEGAVIPHGEAEVMVSELPREALSDPAKFLSRKYDVDILGTTRSIPNGRARSHCHSFKRIVATFEIAPVPQGIQRNVFYICAIGNRAVLTTYTTWKSDKPRPDREKVAENIAKSVRFRGSR